MLICQTKTTYHANNSYVFNAYIAYYNHSSQAQSRFFNINQNQKLTNLPKS